ncbi:MAG: hypothetical protein AAF596_05115, partial [Planctomycetota bacterium]
MTNNEAPAGVALRVFRIPLSALPFCALLALGLLLTAPAPSRADTDLSDPDAAVEAGRSGLRSQNFTPWYDRETDGLRPLNRPPRRPTPSSSWLDTLFGWLGGLSSLGELLMFLMWLVVAALVVWIVIALLR